LRVGRPSSPDLPAEDTANDLTSRSGSMCIDLAHKILSLFLVGIIRDEKGTSKMEPLHLFIIGLPVKMDIMANERHFNIGESSPYEILLMQIMLLSWNLITTAEINTFPVLFFYWLEHKKPNKLQPLREMW